VAAIGGPRRGCSGPCSGGAKAGTRAGVVHGQLPPMGVSWVLRGGSTHNGDPALFLCTTLQNHKSTFFRVVGSHFRMRTAQGDRAPRAQTHRQPMGDTGPGGSLMGFFLSRPGRAFPEVHLFFWSCPGTHTA
jgi:hypothetical protein